MCSALVLGGFPSAESPATLDAGLDIGGVGEDGGWVTIDFCLCSAVFEGGG